MDTGESGSVDASFPPQVAPREISRALTVDTIQIRTPRATRRSISDIAQRTREALSIVTPRTVERLSLGISPCVSFPSPSGEPLVDTEEEYFQALKNRLKWRVEPYHWFSLKGSAATVLVDLGTGVNNTPRLTSANRHLVQQMSSDIPNLPTEARRALNAFLMGLEDGNDTYAVHLYRSIEAARTHFGTRSWRTMESHLGLAQGYVAPLLETRHWGVAHDPHWMPGNRANRSQAVEIAQLVLKRLLAALGTPLP